MKVNSEGVSASWVYLPAGKSCLTLLDFFVGNFPHIEIVEWMARFSEGLVMTIDGQAVAASDSYLPLVLKLFLLRSHPNRMSSICSFP